MSSFSTSCSLNLRKIALEGINVELKRESGSLIMRLRKPSTTATIWQSGKINCAGATSEADALKAARRFCRLIQKIGFKVKLEDYRIVNVFANCKMPFPIHLFKLAEMHPKESSYEPELCSGVVFKIKHLKSTLKLFSSGNVTIFAPSIEAVKQSVGYIYPIVYQFKRSILAEKCI